MDTERVKDLLISLSLADHVGDVNRELGPLARALDLPEPEYSSKWGRMVFPWEEDRWGDRDL